MKVFAQEWGLWKPGQSKTELRSDEMLYHMRSWNVSVCVPCQQKYLPGGKRKSQSSVWDCCQVEIWPRARLPTGTWHEAHMLVIAVVRSWLRVKGLNCINRNKTWVIIAGRKNKDKKCFPELFLTSNTPHEGGLVRWECSSHKEWWMHAAHKSDEVRASFLARIFFYYYYFFWQWKLLLIHYLWGDL